MSKSSMGFLGVALLVGSICYAADDKRHFIVQESGYKNTSELVRFLCLKYCVTGELNLVNHRVCLTDYRQQMIDQPQPALAALCNTNTPQPALVTPCNAAVQREQEMVANREQDSIAALQVKEVQKASAKERIDELRKQVAQAEQAARQRAKLLEESRRKEEQRTQQRLVRSEKAAALQAAKSALVPHLPRVPVTRVPAPLVLRDQQPVKGPQSNNGHRSIQASIEEDRPLSPFNFETDFPL